MDKNAFRQMLKSAPVSKTEWEKDGEAAFKAFETFEPFLKAETVAAYMPMQGEAQIQPVLRLILDRGKRLLLPRVISKTDMAFFQVADFNHLAEGSYGILEPKAELSAYTGKVDLMVIPLLALALDGTRLGRGGGYYDRYLAKNPATTVAIVNKNRLFSRLPEEKHDVKVNYYILEGKWVSCGGK